MLLWVVGQNALAQGPVEDAAASQDASDDAKPAAASTEGDASRSETSPDPEIPDFHLTQVLIDAEAVKDRVSVDLTVEIVINRGEGWHRVPLRLSQAHVRSWEYRGEGEEIPDISRSPDEGISWLIRGRGKHQLRLSLWVPLRRNISGTQFQLSLPTLPPQFESQLTLRIPDGSAVLRSAKNLPVIDVTRTDEQTEIKASVSGNRLDLAWHTPVTGGEVVAQSGCRFHLKPGVGDVSLTVDQSIELQQAGTEELTIRLPSGFRLLHVSGPQFQSYESVPGREGWVRVRIADQGRNRVDLRWVFTRELFEGGGTVTLDGLQVEGAVREEGVIRIDEFEGHRLDPNTDDSEMVHQISVSQVRQLAPGPPLIAYEFVKQPFRLTVDVTPTVPYFTADPVYELIFHEEEIELRLHSLIRLDRGGLTELDLQWRDYESDGWSVVSAESNRETGRLEVVSTGETGQLQLSWPRTVMRDVRLTSIFRRPLPEDLDGPFPITLPVPQSSRTASALIALRAADPFELKLEPAAGDLLQEVDREGVGAWRLTTHWDLPAERLDQSDRFLRLTDPAAALDATITAHQREVEASTVIEIDEVIQDALAVRQTVSLDVRYGRVHEISFLIPDALLEHIPSDAVADGLEVWLGPTQLQLLYASGVLKAVLPSAMKGTFELHVEYRFPVDSGDQVRDADLPFLTLEETPFSTAQCLVAPFETVQVRGRGTAWEAVRTSPRGALWIATGNGGTVSRVPVSVGRRLADAAQKFVVEKAIYRTRFIGHGLMHTWAEFQLVAPPSRLVVQFPDETTISHLEVDGQILDRSAISRRSDDNPDEITLALPPHSSANRVIAVRYENPLPSRFGLAQQQQVQFPHFGSSVWIDETVWEMHLPLDHHLFTYPDLDPLFAWTRNVMFWHRTPKASYLTERESLTQSQVPDEYRFEAASFYAFRGFGPVDRVTFWSMNRSLILLIGAGFTLLLGFVFWKFPATRNAFSLVVIAFLFAAASLWYLEPMLLLLQPAVLGVVLALAATMIDSFTRQRPSDRSSLSGSRFRGFPQAEEQLSANASTRIYQPPHGAAVPTSAAEQGTSRHGGESPT
jgi:hypothetical protein